jgi:hypothetical protein
MCFDVRAVEGHAFRRLNRLGRRFKDANRSLDGSRSQISDIEKSSSRDSPQDSRPLV